MPFLLDRRGFLKGSVAAASLWGARLGLRAESGNARVALLADTHIAADPEDTFRGFFPHRNLRIVCDSVKSTKFDLLVVNGDLARRTGEVGDYTTFRGFIDPLAEQIPTVVMLGNHDERKNARSALTNRAGEIQPVEQKLVTTIDAGPLRFAMLDSLLVTNISPGQVGKKQREWLSTYLDGAGQKPTIVFVHHNPDAESDGALVDADRLLAILKPRRAVKALIFGHTHVYAFDKIDGMHLVNLPAVGYNFADGNPVGWVEASFSGQGAKLQLHAVAGEKDDGRMTELIWR
ncbi:MAG: metallophosphoesterase [Acidobacteriaceae bacterium]|nr:metallophosphoesterase [Acidobacteriaceae bacterium]